MEINFNSAILQNISIHYIGCKLQDENLMVSDSELELDDETSEKLTQTMLPRFEKVFDEFHFFHSSSLEFNEVYSFVSKIFDSRTDFHSISTQIAQHLYDSSEHPKIQAGELYVCYFDNIILGSRSIDAIGIFKTESKADFFQLNQKKNNFEMQHLTGIDFNKFEKGTLIFNQQPEEGFKVLVIDNQKSGGEARYWKDDFLGLQIISNEFLQTKEVMGMTKNFIAKKLAEDFDVSKADQIDLLNKSVEYFKNKESYNREEFVEEVFQDQNVINSFNNFDAFYKEENHLDYSDSFEISTQAVKSQAKVFKSVIKLDKNFHIYIHGNKNLIEQGTDENGRKYYKIFYNEEF